MFVVVQDQCQPEDVGRLSCEDQQLLVGDRRQRFHLQVLKKDERHLLHVVEVDRDRMEDGSDLCEK